MRIGASRGSLADRKDYLYETPPEAVRTLLRVERLPMMHREGWAGPKTGNSGAPFAWFVFSAHPRPAGSPIALHRMSWRAA